MQGFEDDIDDYGEYDEYDEYGGEELDKEVEEEEAEHEQEEDRQPTREEVEYLELRQRLKESIRKKMKRESNAAHMNSKEKKRKLPYDDFGSFFGPSQPVISSRVIQESKSLLENQQLASKLLNPCHTSKKTVSSSSKGSKDGSYDRRPKVVSELKRKVEKLKDTRDYSFLLSDDAELPAPSKEPPSRSTPVLNSEAQSARLPAKPKQPLGVNGRNAHGGREEEKLLSMNGQIHSKPGSSGSQMHSKPGSSGSQMHSRPGSSGSQLHSRPGSSGSQLHSRPGSSGSQLHSRPGSSGSQLHSRPGSSGSQLHSRPGSLHSRPGSSGSQMHSRPGSSGSQMHSKPGSSTNGQMHSRPGTSNSQISSKLGTQKPASIRKPDSKPLDSRKQLGNNNGIGPGRPMGATKALPPKRTHVSSLEKKYSSGTKNLLPSAQRPSSSKTQSSDMRRRVEQRKVSHEPSRSQMIPKQSAAPSKLQIHKPLKQAPYRNALDDRLPKKKPAEMSEDDLALSMIRKMFKIDRFAGRGFDDDDSDMEANFDDIMREEKRSARIARKEDEEQLRLIEEEERQERMRKMAKKRKLSH